MRVKPRVLMVTGAYFPETSGGGLQARAVVLALRDQVDFTVLTTSTNPSLPSGATDEGVSIRRIYVDVASVTSQLAAAVRFALALLRLVPRSDIVNQHGFSRKAILMRLVSRLFGKRFYLTLQTAGEDEPPTVRRAGRWAYWAYTHADLYISVSPGFSKAYLDAGLPPSRLRQISNAVDVQRFAPAAPDERAALRAELGLPGGVPIVMFVGFFSRDKRPDLLYRTWSRIAADHASAVVFIGATRVSHKEIDPALADAIRRDAEARGLADRLVFVEATPTIERYLRVADVYVLPSIREGLPIALLEAMATGLACVATHLPGATDVLIQDGVNGRLIAPDDEAGFAGAIARLLEDRATADRFGAAARQTVVDSFSIQRTAAAWLAAYRETAA